MTVQLGVDGVSRSSIGVSRHSGWCQPMRRSARNAAQRALVSNAFARRPAVAVASPSAPCHPSRRKQGRSKVFVMVDQSSAEGLTPIAPAPERDRF